MAAGGQHYAMYAAQQQHQQQQQQHAASAAGAQRALYTQWDIGGGGYAAVARPQQHRQSPAYPQPNYPATMAAAAQGELPTRDYYNMMHGHGAAQVTPAGYQRAASAAIDAAGGYMCPRGGQPMAPGQHQAAVAASTSYAPQAHLQQQQQLAQRHQQQQQSSVVRGVRSRVPPSSSAYAPTPPAVLQQQQQQHHAAYAQQAQAYAYSSAPMMPTGQGVRPASNGYAAPCGQPQAMVHSGGCGVDDRLFTSALPDGVLLPPFQLEHNRVVSERQFYLPPQLHARLAAARGMQLQLRCFHRDDASGANNWPGVQQHAPVAAYRPSVAVSVNGVETPVGAANKPLYVKQHCKPGNNVLSITVRECCCSHYFSLQLVERTPVEYLARSIVNTQMIRWPDAKQRMTMLLQQCGGSASELPLRCPLTRRRIEVPARGMNCGHTHCFDLEAFLLHYSERSAAAMACPACGMRVSLDTLQVDEFVCSVLGATRNVDPTGESLGAVRLDPAEPLGWRYLTPHECASIAASATTAGAAPCGAQQRNGMRHAAASTSASALPAANGVAGAGGKRRKSTETAGHTVKRQRSDPPPPQAQAPAESSIMSPYSLPSASSAQWIMSPAGRQQQQQQQHGSAQKAPPQPSPLTPGTPGQCAAGAGGYAVVPVPSVPSTSTSSECPASVAGSAPFTPASVGSTGSAASGGGGPLPITPAHGHGAQQQQQQAGAEPPAPLDSIDQAALDDVLGNLTVDQAPKSVADWQLYLNDSLDAGGGDERQSEQAQRRPDADRTAQQQPQSDLDFDDLMAVLAGTN